MTFGIFTGHGYLAMNAVQSAEKIIGVQDRYAIVSNNDLSSEEIFGMLDSIVKKHENENSFFVFIDFYGSSISIPAVRLKQTNESKITLFFGYNMPVILDFFIHRGKKNPRELYNKLIEVGRMGIR